ncbi:MAG: transporter, partial [Planctomycetota bacterium]
LSRRIQLFLSTPVGWGNSEFSFVGFDEFDNKGGIGDIRGGASILLIRGEEYFPEVIGTIAFTAPSGDYTSPVLSLTPGSALGEGFWALSGNLLFIHTYDPVTLFYGFGVRQRFENEFRGIGLIEPGTQFIYQLGVGFAVNERITLSTAFVGMYITEDRLDHRRLEGSILEPLRLRFAVTAARNRRIIEPFAEIGMTDDAPAATAGIIWTF